ncbi:MAG TPA: LamG domain-containing protein [Steroidobacteraceae bacterium]|nr:LamG domain-containing protein [Steroidobacteraceae bacterium]
MKRVFNHSVARLAGLALLAVAVLSGCGGGAATTTNPVTTPPTSGPTYSGPPPATADIQAFRINFWENVRGTNRCGSCHTVGGQSPQFARSDDVNAAYQQAGGVVNRDNPSQSIIVAKVGGGHNCWLADAGACASIMTRWIQDWVGASGTGGRQIELVEPPSKDPGSTRRLPANAPSSYFTDGSSRAVFTLVTTYCSDCHRSTAATKQSPFFAAADVQESYQNAIPKMNLDDAANSRFVIRLGRESHNCWSDCATNAAEMQAAIQMLADSIQPTQVDPNLITSKALTLFDGTIASGGNRYENNLIALYEFKSGQGTTAFDTSGVDPAADLTMSGDVTWVGGWGINIRSGKAQASTTASRKFQQLITATGEYSIEAWVVPGNVVQEDARIISYSGSTSTRNFTMGQTMYNYDFFGRSSTSDANGSPQLSTADADERLQASLQHVVMTYDPVNGRRIYVNGEFTGDVDGAGGGTLGDWDNSYAFVLGNEVSNNRQWQGVIRLVAIHNRALTLEQIQQNFQAGVGEKFFMLFGISHLVNVPKSYILFEAQQYDSSGYLFTNPKYISLDATAMPGSIPLKGMRIGVNGAEPHVGQAYRLMDTVIQDSQYSAATGQTLSTVGTIIGLEQGPSSDEFYLCFDTLGTRSDVCSTYASAVPPTFVNVSRPSDIGFRTFDKINATMSSVTGVSPNTAAVKSTFTNIRQSLPAVDSIEAFLSSHQTAIAQLAIQYCDALVESPQAATYFPGLNLNGAPSTVFGNNAGKDLLIDPLIDHMIGTNVTSQPSATELKTPYTPANTATDGPTRPGLYTLIDTLNNCGGSQCPASRTKLIAKATCGAVLGSGATLID